MQTAAHLKQIVDRKREDVAERSRAVSLAEVRARAEDTPPPRDFAGAVSGRGQIRLIAEIKKASPSKGLIRPDFRPAEIARAYFQGGASALSVLTEQRFFLGDPSYIMVARNAAPLPVLRKDFLFDPWQIHESRALGADAVLLIVAMLEDSQIRDLEGLAASYGMAALIEVHTEEELRRVPGSSGLVGINNRNLDTFDLTLDTSRTLIPLARSLGGDGRIVVAESGIFTSDDARDMRAAGADAILVGESLMRQPDVETATHTLLDRRG